MAQLTTIAKKHQANALHCYWVMMTELESTARNGGCKDAVLKLQVEGFYRLWNEMTQSEDQPSWLAIERADANIDPAGVWQVINDGEEQPTKSGLYHVRCGNSGDQFDARFDAQAKRWFFGGKEIVFGAPGRIDPAGCVDRN